MKGVILAGWVVLGLAMLAAEVVGLLSGGASRRSATCSASSCAPASAAGSC